MSFFSSPLPWLDKPATARRAADLILRSSLLAGGFVGYVDHAEGQPWWVPPRGGRRFREAMEKRLETAPFRAPADAVERALVHLAEHHRSVSSGTFVFVLSDLVPTPSDAAWFDALQRRWDVVPVVIQDPVWEQSFPDVSGMAVPFVDAGTGRVSLAALREHEAAERREANERRYSELVRELQGLAMDPVVVSSHEHRDVVFSFLSWADQRLLTRGRP